MMRCLLLTLALCHVSGALAVTKLPLELAEADLARTCGGRCVAFLHTRVALSQAQSNATRHEALFADVATEVGRRLDEALALAAPVGPARAAAAAAAPVGIACATPASCALKALVFVLVMVAHSMSIVAAFSTVGAVVPALFLKPGAQTVASLFANGSEAVVAALGRTYFHSNVAFDDTLCNRSASEFDSGLQPYRQAAVVTNYVRGTTAPHCNTCCVFAGQCSCFLDV